ncbi:MAG: Tfp pilus assembly protein PilB, type pilus assembly protein PilB [Candidatus Taylorbacteria bacterium]|nr:Tfp pilus assembly protein PilB, type pilus assembly protein PilB [Candidatus Taylorbacteria bacterium]
MILKEKQLEEFVLDSGLVDKTTLLKAKQDALEKKQPLGDFLVSNGKITEDDLRRISAYILGIPFVDLGSGLKIDFDILSLVPEPIARKHNIVAYKKGENGLEIAMLDIGDLNAIDFIKKKTGLKILPRLTTTESIKAVLLQYQKSLKADFGDLIQKESANITTVAESEGQQNADDLKKMAEDLPVVRIVDTLLKHAILQDASDIHIEQYENEVVIRYRIDGILHDAMVLPKNAGAGITARLKVLSSLKLDEKRLPQDGRFKIDLNGEKVAFRVSILPTYYGEKTVMRLLREGVSGFTLESLGFHGDALEQLHEGTKLTTGMILTTGPTGSGKSTTLYTMLDIVNTPDVNISTIEDPVEYQMKRVNQTQVKPEIGFTFSSGLRSLVRQDPDIIMVGEIRDNETASLAINAALTGHLVLSTLHTNSAAGAIPRLLDMHAEPFLLVSTLNIIIGQRLVRRLFEPKEKFFLTKAEQTVLAKKVNLDKVMEVLKKENIVDADATWDKVPFWKPNITTEHPDGFHSRIGIHEVLKVTPTIRTIIMKGGTSDDIEDQAKKEGMLTMIEDGIVKAIKGFTVIEEVLRVISE